MADQAAGTASGRLTRRDLAIGTVIALIMGTAFARLSSGASLLVTFIPGLAVSWLLFLRLYLKRTPLPDGARFLPVFFTALAVQFVHFAEEFLTGFPARFPALYGGAAYPEGMFVTFNMASYSPSPGSGTRTWAPSVSSTASSPSSSPPGTARQRRCPSGIGEGPTTRTCSC
jgi:hypothetical protein